jgi:phosphate-selective porin OprO/OprP
MEVVVDMVMGDKRLSWRRSRRPLSLILLFLIYANTASPQFQPPHTSTSRPQLFDNIWNATTLYDNPDNAAIQSFTLVGRYHGQYWSVEADQGKARDWENRRFIFGFQTQIYNDFLFELQIHMDDEFSPVYEGLYVGFIKWAPKDHHFSTSLGRLDYVFTGLERTTSSKKMATFERGLLVNQLMPGEVFGLYGDGDLGSTSFQAGLFTGANTEEFGDFDSGYASLLGLAYDLPLFYNSGEIHLDYLYSDGDARNTAFSSYQRVVSLWHQGSIGAFSLGTDITLGNNDFNGGSDVSGLTLLPTYDLSENILLGGDALQLALRYQYARSKNHNGLQLQNRYEQNVATGAGDHYRALYVGLNYFLNDDKLKLMTGAEYAEMDDAAHDGGKYLGWTYFAGLRLYF